MDRRLAFRIPCDQPATVFDLRTSAEPFPATLRDHSQRGARLLVPHYLPPHTPVRLDVAGMMFLGDVCYCHQEPDGFAVGVTFEHAVLECAALARLLERLNQEQPDSTPAVTLPES
ncbi:MAG: PilZ domain-containing protein [Acidobacteria bacterium]|nr:PilZ domain-containing protein [Acidobacteriota bacterium]